MNQLLNWILKIQYSLDAQKLYSIQALEFNFLITSSIQYSETVFPTKIGQTLKYTVKKIE